MGVGGGGGGGGGWVAKTLSLRNNEGATHCAVCTSYDVKNLFINNNNSRSLRNL